MIQKSYAEALAKLPLDRAKAVEFAQSKEGRQLAENFQPVITWCTELERLNKGNPANFLLAGAYSETIYICALVPFCFYRSAYMSLRSVIDEVLGYSYYMNHPVELRTAIRKEGVYLTRESFWSYHSEHTPDFGKVANETGLTTECVQIYSDLSKTIHARVPDHICMITSFSDIQFSSQAITNFIKMQDRTCRMLGLFALIAFRDFFRDLSFGSKKIVVRGVAREQLRRIAVKP